MKRAAALAERAASLSLGLIAALNMLFLAAFIATLVIATTNARAEPPECSGTNLLARMASEEPARLEKIRAAAAAVENGEALLWRVEAEDRPPSWLFGTMHLSDPRVVKLDDAVRDAFHQAQT